MKGKQAKGGEQVDAGQRGEFDSFKIILQIKEGIAFGAKIHQLESRDQ